MSVLLASSHMSLCSTVLIDDLLLGYRIESGDVERLASLETRSANLVRIEYSDLTHLRELLNTLVSASEIIPALVDWLAVGISFREERQWEPLHGLDAITLTLCENAVGPTRLFASAKLGLNTLTTTQLGIGLVIVKREEPPLVTSLGDKSAKRLTYVCELVEIERLGGTNILLKHRRDVLTFKFNVCFTHTYFYKSYFSLSDIIWALVLERKK